MGDSRVDYRLCYFESGGRIRGAFNFEAEDDRGAVEIVVHHAGTGSDGAELWERTRLVRRFESPEAASPA
jgi:hypothetical protein